MKMYLIFMGLLITSTCNAWVFTGEVTITEVIQWENEKNIVLVLSNPEKTKCYVPLIEKNLHSLVLSLYMSGKTFNAHCHDVADDVGGYPSHKIHRINAH